MNLYPVISSSSLLGTAAYNALECAEGVVMVKIDCLGDMCPVPVLRLKTVIDSLKNGEECMLVTDHSCTISNIEAFCKVHHLTYDTDEVMNGVWEITISANK